MIDAPAADRFRSLPASPLAGVSASAWARFFSALEVQGVSAVSPSGGLGSYDLRPRRLVEIGLADKLRYVRGPGGRCVHVCDFLPPFSRAAFLANPVTQYMALSRSLSRYHVALLGGEIQRPEGVSLAGALAILHRGGTGALRAWPRLFSDTRALYERAQGAF